MTRLKFSTLENVSLTINSMDDSKTHYSRMDIIAHNFNFNKSSIDLGSEKLQCVSQQLTFQITHITTHASGNKKKINTYTYTYVYNTHIYMYVYICIVCV